MKRSEDFLLAEAKQLVWDFSHSPSVGIFSPVLSFLTLKSIT
jgi:hypothetical protein